MANGSVNVDLNVTPHVAVPELPALDATIQPGYTTTEFWTTLLMHVLAALTLAYTVILHRTFSAAGTTNGIIPVAALLASAIGQAWYSHSRGMVKQAVVYSTAQVLGQVTAAASAQAPYAAVAVSSGQGGATTPTTPVGLP